MQLAAHHTTHPKTAPQRHSPTVGILTSMHRSFTQRPVLVACNSREPLTPHMATRRTAHAFDKGLPQWLSDSPTGFRQQAAIVHHRNVKGLYVPKNCHSAPATLVCERKLATEASSAQASLASGLSSPTGTVTMQPEPLSQSGGRVTSSGSSCNRAGGYCLLLQDLSRPTDHAESTAKPRQ